MGLDGILRTPIPRFQMIFTLSKTTSCIYPDFFDANGDSLPKDLPLPVGVELPARMIILIDEMRERTHRSVACEGMRFYCKDGGSRAAEGRITRITGLFTPRESSEMLP
jgi:hypothetical protein